MQDTNHTLILAAEFVCIIVVLTLFTRMYLKDLKRERARKQKQDRHVLPSHQTGYVGPWGPVRDPHDSLVHQFAKFIRRRVHKKDADKVNRTINVTDR